MRHSLRYNARSANLALHGLHPRGLHALVNSPLLFAPLLPPAAASAYRAWRRLRTRTHLQPGADATALALAACVLLPLAALSAAPHQEPRFLLPLLLPLAALGGGGALASARRVLAWTVFNAVLALFYGGAHQAGVLPALSLVSHLAHGRAGGAADAARAALAASAHALPPACAAAGLPALHALFWRTYPPPASLLLLPASDASRRVRLTDVRDAAPSVLTAALAAPDAAACGACALRLLAAPAHAPPPPGAAQIALLWPHFSGEDAGEALAALAAGAPLSRALGLALYALPPPPCDDAPPPDAG